MADEHTQDEATRIAGWIGVDLDGTLAMYEHSTFDPFAIGPPVPAMVTRVKEWIAKGYVVKIVTARVDGGDVAATMGTERPEVVAFYRNVEGIVAAIQAWCVVHVGRALPVTNRKDYGMVELWDDRAVRVVTNTGERCCDVAPGERTADEAQPRIIVSQQHTPSAPASPGGE